MDDSAFLKYIYHTRNRFTEVGRVNLIKRLQACKNSPELIPKIAAMYHNILAM